MKPRFPSLLACACLLLAGCIAHSADQAVPTPTKPEHAERAAVVAYLERMSEFARYWGEQYAISPSEVAYWQGQAIAAHQAAEAIRSGQHLSPPAVRQSVPSANSR